MDMKKSVPLEVLSTSSKETGFCTRNSFQDNKSIDASQVRNFILGTVSLQEVNLNFTRNSTFESFREENLNFTRNSTFESFQEENQNLKGHSAPNVQTPVNNMGSLDTFNGLSVILDYLTFSMPTEKVKYAFDLLGIDEDDFVKFDRGMYFYRKMWRCGHIIVLADGSVPGMGVCVSMTGQGCREYESRFGNRWFEFFRKAINRDCKFTRIDIAVDDKQGHFTMEMAHEKVRKGEVRTVFKSARGTVKYSLKLDAPNAGETVNFGSAASSVQVRIYDKAKERGVDYLWNRVEVQVRDDRANSVARLIASGRAIGVIACGVLSRYLTFVERSGDSNKARWMVSEWWLGFVGAVEKIRLTIDKASRTVAEVANWVERQVAPSLALLKKAYGSGYASFFRFLLCSGEERLKERHYLILGQGMNA